MRKPGLAARLLLLAALLASVSCVFLDVRTSPDIVRLVRGGVWPELPSSYRMVHRIRLDIGGRGLDLLGYLAVAGDRWRAMAFSEMGVSVFDFICEGGRSDVLLSPRGLPRAPLRDGVMREIGAAFASGAGRPTRAQDKAPADQERTAGAITMILLRGGSAVSEISVLSTRVIEGWPVPVPEHLLIRNRKWGYTMDVALVRMDLKPVEEAAFKRSEGLR